MHKPNLTQTQYMLKIITNPLQQNFELIRVDRIQCYNKLADSWFTVYIRGRY